MELNPLTKHIAANEIPLERLAANSQLSEAEKLEGVSKHFEAIFLRQFLMEGQKPLLNPKDPMGNASNQIYRDMMVNHMADEISKSGSFGLAKFFQQQLAQREPAAPKETDATKP
jgi:Rod binding domain-containing protein